MAQALGLLVFGSASGVTLGGVALTSAVGVLTPVGVAFNIGASLLLSAASSALFAPDLPQAGPDSLKVNTASEALPRIKHQGEVRTGYAIVFTSAKSGKLYRLIVHGHGEIDGVEEYYVDKGGVEIDAAGFVTTAQYGGASNSHLQILHRRGIVPEAPYQELLDDFPEWSADHRLDGLSTSLMIARLPSRNYINQMYPNREPTLEAVIRSSKVTDPRTGVASYSDNLASCAYSYEIDPDGANIADLVDTESYAAAAEVCGVNITIANQEPEYQFRFAGSWDLNEDPAEVRKRYLAACGGENYITPQGKLGLRVGGYEEPTFTLTEDMLAVGGVEVEFGLDAVSSYSSSAFQYVAPSHKHSKISGDPYIDEERVAAIGEVKKNPFISSPSHRQCRHAAKILMEQENPEIVIKAACKPVAFEAFYERFIRVELPRMGVAGVFQIKTKSVNPQTLAPSYTLNLVRKENTELPLSEYGVEPEYGDIVAGSSVPAPEGLTVIAAGVQTAANTFSAGIAIGWDAAPYDSLVPRIEVASQVITPVDMDDDIVETVWQIYEPPAGSTSYRLSGLVDGRTYYVKMAWVAASGSTGPYAPPAAGGGLAGTVAIIARAVSSLPDEPTNLAVTDAGGTTARIELTTSTSEGLHKTNIYRDGVLVSSPQDPPDTDIVIFDTPVDGSDVPLPGTYTYSAISENVSGLVSTSNPSVTITIA